MSQDVGNAKNVDGLERKLYNCMVNRTIENYRMWYGLLLTDVGRKVGDRKENNSLCAFVMLSLQTPTVYHYQSQDSVPHRASRKNHNSDNHRKIFGRGISCGWPGFYSKFHSRDHFIADLYADKTTKICCVTEIIEACIEKLYLVSTACSFGSEYATATTNQLHHFTKS